MADIKPTNPINIEERLKDLELFKYHPSSMVGVSLNILSDILDGRVEILEPSNPLAYLIEVGALNTAFSIQEYALLTRQLYPLLANNEKDLYKHMSDKDYLNRFSEPAFAKVTFSVLLNDFRTKAYTDPVTKDLLFTLPRNYRVSLDGYVFSLTSPVTIRMTEGGVLDVRHDNSLTDDIFPIKTDYLDFIVRSVNQEEKYIEFNLELPEIDITVSNVNIIKSKYMKGVINYPENRSFYYCKAFHSDDGVNWTEMRTTHTEDVWDIDQPTCIVKVMSLSKTVEYYIPPVYVNKDKIGSKVRILVYTTRGSINLNFSDYNIKDFKLDYNKVFPEQENTPSTAPLNRIVKHGYIRDRVIGGRNGKTFQELKQDVMNNNLVPHLPITHNQIENILRNSDLTPIRNFDVVTGREFLVKTKIPSNVSRYRIARMSLDLIEFATSLSDLRSNKNNIIEVSKDIVVIPEGTIFEIEENTKLRILSTLEANQLESLSGMNLTNHVNSRDLLSTYYHYVLDNANDTTELRAYEINTPSIIYTNFRDYNNSTRVGANTVISEIEKIDTGYRMNFLTGTKRYDNEFDISNITPYIVYTSENGNHYFLEGKLYSDLANNTVFSFYFDTNCYVNREDKLFFTNFKDNNGMNVTIDLDLTQDLDIFYTTNIFPSSFVPTYMDDIFSESYLNGQKAVVTRETHRVRFGDRLKYLFTRVHSSIGDNEYQRYENDVYRRYESTVYNKDNEVVHNVNEIMLDDNGNPIIQHHAGDVIVGDDNRPLIQKSGDIARYLNLLLVDYKVTIGNSVLLNEYKSHVRQTLNTLLLTNMVELQEALLERTDAYLTVPNGLTNLIVEYNGIRGYMASNQSFKFNVYCNRRVYDDNDTRAGIESTIRETLDEYLTGNRTLSRTELIRQIFNRTEEFVRSIEVDRFTELDADHVQILTDNAEVSIKKRLIDTADGYDVIDDISYNFILVS